MRVHCSARFAALYINVFIIFLLLSATIFDIFEQTHIHIINISNNEKKIVFLASSPEYNPHLAAAMQPHIIFLFFIRFVRCFFFCASNSYFTFIFYEFFF
jgi:hypothetical protein